MGGPAQGDGGDKIFHLGEISSPSLVVPDLGHLIRTNDSLLQV